jgi:hypothetical protein
MVMRGSAFNHGSLYKPRAATSAGLPSLPKMKGRGVLCNLDNCEACAVLGLTGDKVS